MFQGAPHNQQWETHQEFFRAQLSLGLRGRGGWDDDPSIHMLSSLPPLHSSQGPGTCKELTKIFRHIKPFDSAHFIINSERENKVVSHSKNWRTQLDQHHCQQIFAPCCNIIVKIFAQLNSINRISCLQFSLPTSKDK